MFQCYQRPQRKKTRRKGSSEKPESVWMSITAPEFLCSTLLFTDGAYKLKIELFSLSLRFTFSVSCWLMEC